MASTERGKSAVSQTATRSKSRSNSPSSQRLLLDDDQLLQELTARTGQASRRRSLTSSLGLGHGVAGRLTAAALVTLLLIAIGSPAAYHKEQQKKQDVSSSKASEQVASKAAAAAASPPAAAAGEARQVPLTPDLQARFYALQFTREKGLLKAASEPDWQPVSELLVASVERMSEDKPLKPDSEANLRRMMAMDLACLENKAVEAQEAIDEARKNTEDGTPASLALLFQAKIDVRRQEGRAAELWEQKLKAGALGSDPDLKKKISKFLAAIRSRAAASEYFLLALMQAKEEADEEAAKRLFAEANRAYEALAFVQAAAIDKGITNEKTKYERSNSAPTTGKGKSNAREAEQPAAAPQPMDLHFLFALFEGSYERGKNER
ncbi:hypothetical protein Efla_000045 [Eimeria flavescens]